MLEIATFKDKDELGFLGQQSFMALNMDLRKMILGMRKFGSNLKNRLEIQRQPLRAPNEKILAISFQKINQYNESDACMPNMYSLGMATDWERHLMARVRYPVLNMIVQWYRVAPLKWDAQKLI